VNSAKQVEIVNDAAVEIPYHLNVLPQYTGNNELLQLYPDVAMTGFGPKSMDGFEISPVGGVFEPNKTIALCIQWMPFAYGAFAVTITVVADEIPAPDGITSLDILTIHLEATTAMPSITANPPFIFYESLVPRTELTRRVDLINDSTLSATALWRKSAVVRPNSGVVGIGAMATTQCSLTCRLIKRKDCPPRFGSRLFPHHTALAKQTLMSETWQVWSSNMGATSALRDSRIRMPITRSFSVGFSLQPERKLLPLLSAAAEAVTSGFLQKGTALSLVYAADIARPMLIVSPPTLDFGFVLISTAAQRTLKLTNEFQCPIYINIDYPQTSEWEVTIANNVILQTESVDIQLTCTEKTFLDALITINMFWCDEEGEKVPGLPATTLEVPVCAIVDRPIIGISNRVLNLGTIFPTLTYTASTEIALLNQFPTDVEFLSEPRDFLIRMPKESESLPLVPHSGSPTIIDVCRTNEQYETVVKEYAQIVTKLTSLEPEHWTKIELTASFSRLGDNAIPIICKTTGNWSKMAVIAHITAPDIRLVTETIDFSGDFAICSRSHSWVHIENVCGVPSTIRIEMIDNCNGVFTLENDGVFDLLPFTSVRVPVSCYSEIHGDYHGELNLRIRDPWQSEDIRIPLHVKARGSYFGFQKHTLGYQQSISGDTICFGEAIIAGSETMIRRISLVNYSSAAITVDWSISNFVKGRDYADLEFTVLDDGDVHLEVIPSPEADRQWPFHMTTTRTEIASHGVTVVIVAFDPKEIGEFGGCVAARSGEFIHSLDLKAIVIARPAPQDHYRR
jgi:hypothetical protein